MGPAVLPAVYVMNMSVLVEARCVWPAMFCPMMVRAKGVWLIRVCVSKS